MIETIDNVLQLIVTAVSAGIAGYRARSGKRAWLLACLFSVTFFLGDLYWLLYYQFYDWTPDYNVVPQLAWNASILFLLLLVLDVTGNNLRRPRPLLWLVPVLTVGMFIFFTQNGAYLSNGLYLVCFTLILWQAAGSLLDREAPRRARAVCWCAVFFCLVEYGLWLASWEWLGDDLSNPYFWFDAALSASFLLILPAVRRAVDG